MARGHHRTSTPHGPDALDWLEGAHDIAVEFNCHVWLEFHHVGDRRGSLVVVAAPPDAPVGLEMAVVAIPHPNTKFQSFWPSAFLLLHRLRRDLETKAYTPPVRGDKTK